MNDSLLNWYIVAIYTSFWSNFGQYVLSGLETTFEFGLMVNLINYIITSVRIDGGLGVANPPPCLNLNSSKPTILVQN